MALRIIKKFKIKTIDMSRDVWELDVASSFKETGFAVLKNHRIPKDMIEAGYAQWKQFFDSEEKFNYVSKEKNKGYFPMKSENAKGSSVKDLKEFYHVFHPFTEVPKNISDITTQSLAFKLNEMARNILHKLQPHIPEELEKIQGEPLHKMVRDSSSTLLRVLHYPPVPEDAEEGAIRAAAHEDINLITLLVSASEAGLQVKDLEGNWIDVEADPNSIIVNVGDMLQEASGGVFKSTTHRVVNPKDKNVSRYSMPFFVHPKNESRLSKRYTAGEYLEERLRELGLVK